MRTEERLKESKLKRILIVDDTPENISAAKESFATYDGIKTDYLTSEKEAVSRIGSTNEPYDLVITDLEMEEKDSGMRVVRSALEKGAYALIATGFNYDNPQGGHGPQTSVIPTKETLKGKKSESFIWDAILDKGLDYISNPEIKMIYKTLSRYVDKLGKVPGIFVDSMMQKYHKS